MKKLFVLLLALVVVGVAFGQEAAPAVKISGLVNPGLQLISNDDNTPKTALSIYGQDQDVPLRAQVTFDYADGDFGLSFRIRTNDATLASTASDGLYAARASVWAKFFNGMVKVNAGKGVNVASFEGASDLDKGSWAGDTGLVLQVFPVAGATIGLEVPATVAGTDTKDVGKSLKLGAAYSMEKLFDFVATYDMAGDSKKSDITLGINVTAVENLKAAIEAFMENASDSATAKNTFTESFAYTMGALKPGIDLYQVMAKDLATGMEINPYVEYTMDKTLFAGKFAYKMAQDGDKSKTTNSMTISASAKQTFNGKAAAKVGLAYTPEYKTVAEVTKKANTKVYLDFIYSF